ncbi:MAG: hypothetical protein NBV67_00925 [Tagaea sp.]|nr:hypothetical protein [Tagaea sp.]
MTGAPESTAPPDWRALLREAVAEEMAKRDGKRGGVAAVADRIGYSRTAVSQVLNGYYGAKGEDHAKTRWIEAAVLRVYGGGHVPCPHLARAIRASDCASWQTRPAPRSNPEAIKHWHACASCAFATKENLKERGR